MTDEDYDLCLNPVSRQGAVCNTYLLIFQHVKYGLRSDPFSTLDRITTKESPMDNGADY